MKENVMNISEKFVAVENAKVANIKYKYYHVGTTGLLADCGAAVSVKVTSVTFNLRTQESVTTLVDARGKEYTRNGEFYLYDTLDKFKNGIAIGRKIVAAWELLQWAGGDKTTDCETPVIDVDEEKETSNTFLTVFVYDDGDAIRVPVLVNAVTWDEENGKHISDGTLPDNYWSNKADAYNWNAYKFIDEDGDEFVEKSNDLRLVPTDAQKAILKDILGMFKKAKDAGLMLFVDNNGLDNGILKAFNVNDVVMDFENATPDMLCGTDVYLSDVNVTNVGVEFHVGDNEKILFKPTDRQLKQWKKNHPDA